MGHAWSLFTEPELTPGTHFQESKFDPLFGFEDTGRKKRAEPTFTPEEYSSALIRPEKRDFCAKELMEYKKCFFDNFPFYLRCKHDYHAYQTCEFEDYVIRMKEYEREKRMLARAQRVPPENAGWKVMPQTA